MRRFILNSLVATTAMATAIPQVAFAQEAPEEGTEADAGEIIVEARRNPENVQDIPVSVQVVTGTRLQDLAITKADELSKLSPGLTLVNDGAATAVVLRGVAWTPGSGTPATPIYFNEVPFDPGNTVVSIFDIGQIEVLRGPQGTSRGAPSISGAVTITTKRPDLDEFGGYVQALYGSAKHQGVQGAINLPIVKDVFAIRLAANIEDSEGDRVYSINSTIKPEQNDRSYRATALLKPTDNFSLQAMYQRRTTSKVRYDQVVGAGSPGAARSALFPLGGLDAIPANFNGPALRLSQRASVQDGANLTNEKIDLLTINANWQVFGHNLTFNHGRQYNRSGSSFNSRDPLNFLPRFEPYAEVPRLGSKFTINEIRISSEPSDDRPFDYDIGWYSKKSDGTAGQDFLQYTAGAFGGPAAQPGAVTTPNLAYTVPVSLRFPIGQTFDSFYGNIRFHISEQTELSGGLAILRDRVPVSSITTTRAGRSSAGLFQAIRFGFITPGSPLFGLHTALNQPLPTTCEQANGILAIINRAPGFVTSTTYPGTCDVNVAAAGGTALAPFPTNPKYTKALYNFSLSHKFSDDVMLYATTGTSYRSGLPALGSVGLSNDLLVPKPETARSFEVGLKTSFGRGFTVNVAAYQMNYQDQLTSFRNVQYWNQIERKQDLTSLAFFRNVDSRVRGFEVEMAARPSDNLSLGVNLSYSKIKSKGGLLPANAGSCAGAVAVSANNLINFCPSPAGQVLNQDAPFQATVNGGYDVPLGSLDGYLRFNMNYKGKNPNYNNFPTAGSFRETQAYAVLDLFAGVSGGEKAWDIGFYAKNVFDKQVELSRFTPPNNVYANFTAAPGGYDVVRTSLPREIGVTARFSFGSR